MLNLVAGACNAHCRAAVFGLFHHQRGQVSGEFEPQGATAAFAGRHDYAVDQFPNQCHRLARGRVAFRQRRMDIGHLGAVAAGGLGVQRQDLGAAGSGNTRSRSAPLGFEIIQALG